MGRVKMVAQRGLLVEEAQGWMRIAGNPIQVVKGVSAQGRRALAP